jgi:hypothetical protein
MSAATDMVKELVDVLDGLVDSSVHLNVDRREVLRRAKAFLAEEALAERERSLVATNNNGSNDVALYELRKELDQLRSERRS